MALILTTITITIHYRGMDMSDSVLRGLFRQFCYVPILLSALWFGLSGGIINAAVITAAVSPMLIIHHLGWPAAAQEILEYFYYFLFGSVFGYLSDRERKAQRKREELVKEVSRLEHLGALGEMAAGLAHEIKNPLGSIQGAAEILEPEIEPSHPKFEFMRILLEEVQRLNRVVDHFLSYARPRRPEKKPLPLRALLEQTASGLALTFKDSRIEIEVPPDFTIRADEGLIKQVLLNLARNALEAMHQGGRLEIRARHDDGRDIIDFEDEGPGIPPEERDRVFRPFRTSKENGIGLGLTISERIVIEHGGRIEVDEGRTGGARFRVSLPRKDE